MDVKTKEDRIFSCESTLKDSYDVIVIGAGISGVSLAVGLSQRGVRVLILERALVGGRLSTMSYPILDYPGYAGLTSGDFSNNLKKSLDGSLVDLCFDQVESVSILNDNNVKLVKGVDRDYRASCVVIATGVEPKRLEASLEKEFAGRGISYYPESDASFYSDKDVIVLGCDERACCMAMHLSDYANRVYILGEDKSIRENLRTAIYSLENVTLFENFSLKDVKGSTFVDSVTIENNRTGDSVSVQVSGVFVCLGSGPSDTMLIEGVSRDKDGFIVTDLEMRTSVKGVYAVGDIRSKSVRRLVTAGSDSVFAITSIFSDYFSDK